MATARRRPAPWPSWSKPVPITRPAAPLVVVESLALLGSRIQLPHAQAERLVAEGRVRIVREPVAVQRCRIDHRGRVVPIPET